MEDIHPNVVAEIEGEFGNLIIEDFAGQRFLRFDSEARQAMMTLTVPHKLMSVPLQYILAPLLWQPTPPTHLLLAGIGGGDLIRFVRHYLPKTNITGIDRDATMVDLAKRYFDLPDENTHCRYFIEDAEKFIHTSAQNENQYALMAIDLHLRKGMPEFLDSVSFYEACKANLATEGILALNILPRDKAHLIEIMKTIRMVFDRRCLYAAIPDHDNIAIYAFNNFPAKDITFKEIEDKSTEFSAKFNIDLKHIWQNIRALNPILTGAQDNFSLSDILPR